MLAEKKATPLYQPKKQYDLTRHIAELTEELEELKSERAMLLNSLDCAEDADISAVKKEIATLESGLKKLEERETKTPAGTAKADTEEKQRQPRTVKISAGVHFYDVLPLFCVLC